MFPTDDVDPPAMLRVYVPDHTVNSSVLVFSKMTVDALLDEMLRELIEEQGVDLQGAREGVCKELYGLYAVASQTWCRPQLLASHYGLYNPVGDDLRFCEINFPNFFVDLGFCIIWLWVQEEAQLVELRLKSKYKDEDVTDGYEISKTSLTSKGQLATSNVSRDIHNRKTFRILLAECSLTLQAECDPSTTVQAILLFVCEARESWQGQEDTMEIIAHLQPPNSDAPPSTVILRPPKTLSSNCDYFHIVSSRPNL